MPSGLVMEIHEFAEAVPGPDQTLYAARVYGQPREDGTWEGWLEFSNPLVGTLPTDRETTQSNQGQLTYWATGLEPTYLEGALDRALRR
jgi:hypothetical protein